MSKFWTAASPLVDSRRRVALEFGFAGGRSTGYHPPGRCSTPLVALSLVCGGQLPACPSFLRYAHLSAPYVVLDTTRPLPLLAPPTPPCGAMSFLFGSGGSRDDDDGAPPPPPPTDDLSSFSPDAPDADSPFSLGGSAFAGDTDDLDGGGGGTADAYGSAGLSSLGGAADGGLFGGGSGGSLSGGSGLSGGSASSAATSAGGDDGPLPPIRLDVGALDLSPSFPLDGGDVDYLFLDAPAGGVRKKSWSEQLTYMAGLAYLAGGTAGVAAGARAGLTASAGKPRKLRINAVLNAAGRRGALAANSAAVLAVLFSAAETAAYGAAEEDGAANYAAAGAVAGGVFKSTRGVRVAGAWALGGAALGLAGVYASRQGVYGRGLRGAL